MSVKLGARRRFEPEDWSESDLESPPIGVEIVQGVCIRLKITLPYVL